MSQNKVRTRFAPSPTGELHLGNVRTMLFQALFTQHQQGTFILRIEDTDQERLVEGSAERILESLLWLGLTPDEGVRLDDNRQLTERGDCGPYIQSQRREIYQQHAQQLVEAGQAYYCFATPEELEAMRREQQAKSQPPRYDGRFRESDPVKVQQRLLAGEAHVIRLKMPQTGSCQHQDLVYGAIKWQYKEYDDHVILKSDRLPTYHFASVVDDHLMQISHVFRGEEWISSLPRHLATYQAFGWEPPQYAHLPLIFGSDRQKLSKRHGAKTVLEYRGEGYLPEALINYLVFLGWSPKTEQEIFSWPELVKSFEVKGINRANPIFDQVKLQHLNGVYLRNLDSTELVRRAKPWLKRAGIPVPVKGRIRFIEKAVTTAAERAKTLAEIPDLVRFFFVEPNYDADLIRFRGQTNADCVWLLELALDNLAKIKSNQWSENNIESVLRECIAQAGVKNGELLWPVRAALTGERQSPGVFEVAAIFDKVEVEERLRQAIETLKI